MTVVRDVCVVVGAGKGLAIYATLDQFLVRVLEIKGLDLVGAGSFERRAGAADLCDVHG